VCLVRHRADASAELFDLVDSNRDRLGAWMPWVEDTVSEWDSLGFIAATRLLWDERKQFDFALRRREGDVLMGGCGVHNLAWEDGRCELGYWIGGDHEGVGYVTEAVGLLEWCLARVGFHRIEIRCDPDNVRSAAVPRRRGYELEGVLRDQVWLGDRFRSTQIWAKVATPVT